MSPRTPTIDTGIIYCDDNLARLARIPSESVDLIYLDPPFFSNQNYEVIWGDESEVRSFEDRWRGGIHVYIEWMRHRLIELHRVLKETGTLYLHCDPNASHYLKIMLDDVFGPNRFLSEITWKRTFTHGNVGRSYGAICDSILVYTRGDGYTWNQLYRPFSPEYVQAKFRYSDPDGRRWQSVTLRNPSLRPNLRFPYTASNGKTYEPHPNGWSCNEARLSKYDSENRLHFPTRAGGQLRLKMYLDEARGQKLQNLWDDIPPINSRAQERLGYPTQKPEALLERILTASSIANDVVLDPFAGCGTTIAVAHRLQRRWVGIDISLTATKLMLWRMEKIGADVSVEGLPKTEADLKSLKPFEFQNWVISRFNGKHAPRRSGDFGVDGYSFLEHLPIQVKQSEKVGRVVVDNFETAVKRERKHKGYIVAFSFTRNAYEEVARAQRHEGIEIVLVPVSTLLEDQATVPAPGADQLLHDLLPVVPRADPPTADELIASDLVQR
jgi:DNA modification methylase